MISQLVYRTGQILSLTLWGLVAWSIYSAQHTTFQQLVQWVGLGTLIVHATETSAFFVVEQLKHHRSPKNIMLTLLFGGFQLKWLLDQNK